MALTNIIVIVMKESSALTHYIIPLFMWQMTLHTIEIQGSSVGHLMGRILLHDVGEHKMILRVPSSAVWPVEYKKKPLTLNPYPAE